MTAASLSFPSITRGAAAAVLAAITFGGASIYQRGDAGPAATPTGGTVTMTGGSVQVSSSNAMLPRFKVQTAVNTVFYLSDNGQAASGYAPPPNSGALPNANGSIDPSSIPAVIAGAQQVAAGAPFTDDPSYRIVYTAGNGWLVPLA